MDIRSKHLSSENRGVILAEHNRGSSQRLIGQLLHRPALGAWPRNTTVQASTSWVEIL
jgi:hypothetical protein